MAETAAFVEGPPRRPTSVSSRLLVVLLVVLAVTPVVASAVRLGPGWVPQGDDATIVLRGDDLFTSDTPLVGMPSTVGDAVGTQVHHPGPLESQAIGLVAAVVDDPRVGLAVVALVNLASLLVVLLWAHRLGGIGLLATAAVVVGSLAWSLRGPIVVTPFNPYAAVLPFLACTASLVAAADRRPWAVTSAVVFGSWAAQAHLTTAGPVLAATAAASAVALVRWWLDRTRGTAWVIDRRRAVVGGVVAAACWAAPVIEMVTDGGGNVRALLRAGGSLGGETLGAASALDVIVHSISWRPLWAQAGAGPLDLLTEPSGAEQAVAAVVAASAVAVAVACRRRRPAVTTAVVVVAASLLAGGLLTARIPRSFFNMFALHNYLWLWPASALLWLATAAGLLVLVRSRLTLSRLSWVPLAAACGAAALVAGASLGPPHRPTGDAASTYVRALEPQVLSELDPDGAYRIELDPAIDVYGVGTGLLYALEHAGYDVRVPRRFEPSFGAHRTAPAAGRDRIIVRMGREAGPPPEDGAVAVAAYEPPADLVARRDRLEDALVREIDRRGGVSVATGERIPPEQARAWIEAGEFTSLRSFRLLEPSLAGSAAGRAVAALDDEPLATVTVYLAPAP